MDKQVVGIVGFGRFGQFWSGVLSPLFDILAMDPDPDARRGAVDPGVEIVDLPALCDRARVIFLCTPIHELEAALQSLHPLLRAGTVVFDTCSVKVLPARWMQSHLAGLPVELIASHPMFGPDSGADGLQGLPIVLWPLGPNKTAAYLEWRKFYESLGLRIVEISPEEHDRQAAYSQGVTHFIGRVLGELNLEATAMDTRGFTILRSLVEQTCHDSWELFHDLQTLNPHTRGMRLQLETALNKVYDQLLPARVSPDEIVVGIQGGQGSFNEEACHYYCLQHADEVPRYRIEYLYTAENVLKALHAGEIDNGVFAIQNARGGAVMETIHGMSQYTCNILQVFEIVISHCILHHPAIDFSQVDTIISHPQALAQCAGKLAANYPHLRQMSGQGDLIDQALCAQKIAQGEIPATTAVLAPQVCAEIHGLAIRECGLQDLGDHNLTTFVWVGRRETFK